jgi:hypothetical protein
MTREPEILMRKVPHGKLVPKILAERRLTVWRKQPPNPAPKKTRR